LAVAIDTPVDLEIKQIDPRSLNDILTFLFELR